MRFAALLALSLVLAAPSRAEDPKCVFCAILAGEAPGVILTREGDLAAIMSHKPRNAGHVLVIPLAHAENIYDVPPATFAHMATFAQRVALAIRASGLPADGIQLQLNTGKASGQSVFHAHLHVIPRVNGESEPSPSLPVTPAPELEAAAAKIRAHLAPPAS